MKCSLTPFPGRAFQLSPEPSCLLGQTQSFTIITLNIADSIQIEAECSIVWYVSIDLYKFSKDISSQVGP